jgi:hypothetical protein
VDFALVTLHRRPVEWISVWFLFSPDRVCQLLDTTLEEGPLPMEVPARGPLAGWPMRPRIKALRAVNVVEAAIQRSAKRQYSTEEPVTARIRRKADQVEEQGEARYHGRLARNLGAAQGKV